MAASAPTTPAGDDRNLITIDDKYLALSFEDKLQLFWERNSRILILSLVLVVLVIVGRGGFAYYTDMRTKAIIAEYAALKDAAGLQAFAKEHSTLPLAGLAHLRLADEAYAAGSFRAAEVDYTAAAKVLGEDPLAVRARLGAAISLLRAGEVGAQPALQALANDTQLPRAQRAEAAYHLAVLARDAGQFAEATRWIDLAASNDAAGFWGQRASQFRDTLPLTEVKSADANAQVAPAVSFPATK